MNRDIELWCVTICKKNKSTKVKVHFEEKKKKTIWYYTR